MSRLAKEIRTYQMIVDALQNCMETQDMSEFCASLKITEKACFKFLEEVARQLDVGIIEWDGEHLTLETIKAYNQKNKSDVGVGMKRTARLTKVIDLLNKATPHGGMTIEELTARLEVSERTVYRDLVQLEEELGIALVRPEREAGKAGRYSLKDIYLPPLSPDRALFIYLSLLQQKDTALTLGIEDIKQTLIGTLAKNRFDLKDIPLDIMESRINIVDHTLTEPEKVSEIFLKILKGLEQSKVIRIRYFKSSSQTVSDRTVQPYGLICKHHNWYLVGRCLDNLAIRIFRIDQIESVFVRSETFSYPQDFNIRKFYEKSWGVFLDSEVIEAKIWFSPEVAYRLRKIKYHSSQEIIEEAEDGSVVVKYCITGIIEFIGWLLQWRGSAKVLEPDTLREEMINAVKELTEIYRLA
ncbi:MAG: helix-turn-helix transcriptional regulator [Desulfitobacteriia bacterium]